MAREMVEVAIEFQSTRPHGARPSWSPSPSAGLSFQSTRPHGARHFFQAPLLTTRAFQSTRPHGARQGQHRALGQPTQVSIHAPAWGATPWWRCRPRYRRRFNPRARMGRDPETVLTVVDRPRFQSTRPHGARRFKDDQGEPMNEFQSTRPHGARHVVYRLSCQQGAVSIHAPAWGATGVAGGARVQLAVSIHAPAWGATTASA